MIYINKFLSKRPQSFPIVYYGDSRTMQSWNFLQAQTHKQRLMTSLNRLGISRFALFIKGKQGDSCVLFCVCLAILQDIPVSGWWKLVFPETKDTVRPLAEDERALNPHCKNVRYDSGCLNIHCAKLWMDSGFPEEHYENAQTVSKFLKSYCKNVQRQECKLNLGRLDK
jgi:hypothetical protein